MSVSKIKGQIKETTGKLTGDKALEAEGKIEKGVAEVSNAVGDAANYVLDIFGSVFNTLVGVFNNLYDGVRNMIRKVTP